MVKWRYGFCVALGTGVGIKVKVALFDSLSAFDGLGLTVGLAVAGLTIVAVERLSTTEKADVGFAFGVTNKREPEFDSAGSFLLQLTRHNTSKHGKTKYGIDLKLWQLIIFINT